MKISCAIIGLGFWGQVFLKKILKSPYFELKAVVTRSAPPDLDKNIQVFERVEDLPLDIGFFFILSSVDQHVKAAQLLLKKSKNIFITKPIAPSLKETRTLKDLAQKNKSFVFVDHTFLFNPDFLFFKNLLRGKKIKSAFTQRSQFGRFQNKSDVFGELLYHDIYMLISLFGTAKNAKAIGTKTFGKDVDGATLELEFSKDVKSTSSASMTVASKQRIMCAVSNDKILTWQDMAPSIFTEAKYNFALGREGSAEDPQVLRAPPRGDAIDSMLAHIADCVSATKKSKLIDIENGIEVMQIIDAAHKSIQKNTPVKL